MAAPEPTDGRKRPLAYTTGGIDRAGTLRADAARLQSLLKDQAARLVPVWKQRHLIAQIGDAAPLPRYFNFDEAADRFDLNATPPVFLGMTDQTPWFAFGLPDSESPPEFDGAAFRQLHDVVSLLPSQDASLLAYARGMVIWHGNHLHCGRCGTLTDITEGSHSRTCPNPACNHRTFPRIDPAVITLISHPDGEHCLLGRQAVWPPGFFSTIAGFVEPGESLEATVIREAHEETGIIVGEARYIASQPWPFPSSIMLGFRAYAISTEIHCNDKELEDCRWFTRAEVREFGERAEDDTRTYKLPPASSISRFLVNGWLDEK